MYVGITKNLIDGNYDTLKTQNNLSMDDIQLGKNNYQNLLGKTDWKICLSNYNDKVQGINNTITNIVDSVTMANVNQNWGVHDFEVILTRVKDKNKDSYGIDKGIHNYLYYNSCLADPMPMDRWAVTSNITLLASADSNGIVDYGNVIKNSKFKTWRDTVSGIPFRNYSSNARITRNVVAYINDKFITDNNSLNSIVLNSTLMNEAKWAFTKSFTLNNTFKSVRAIRNTKYQSSSYNANGYADYVKRNPYLGFSVYQPQNYMLNAFWTYYVTGMNLNENVSGSSTYYTVDNILRFILEDHKFSDTINNVINNNNDRSSKWIVSVSEIIYTIGQGLGRGVKYYSSTYTGNDAVTNKWADTNADIDDSDKVYFVIKNRATTDVILNVYDSAIDQLAETYQLTGEVYSNSALMENTYRNPIGTFESLNPTPTYDGALSITKETVFTKSIIELQRKNEYQDAQGNTITEWIDVNKYQVTNTDITPAQYYNVTQMFENLLNNTTYRYRVTNYLKNTNLWSLKAQNGITSPILDVITNQYKDGIEYVYQWHEFNVSLEDYLVEDFLISQCSVETESTCEGYIDVKCKFNSKYSFELNEYNPAINYIASSGGSTNIYLTEITGDAYLKLHDLNEQFTRIRLGISFGVVNNDTQTWTPLYKAVMTNDEYFTLAYSNTSGTIAIQINYYNSGGTSLFSGTTTCVSNGTCTIDGINAINMYEVGIYFSDLAQYISDAVKIKDIYFQGDDDETNVSAPSHLYIDKITVQKNYNNDLSSEDYITILNWHASETDNANASTIGTDFVPYTTELKLRPYGDLTILRKRENSGDFNAIGYHKLWYHNYNENTVHWIGDNEFVIKDIFVPNGSSYVYAIGGYRNDDTNKNVIVTSEPSSCSCNRFMISDKEETFTFIANVKYGSFEVSSQTTYQVAKNRQFPYVMDNSYDKFHTGTVSMDITGESFLIYNRLDKAEIEKEITRFIDFLKSKTTKVIKDWNNKNMMVYILPQPSYSVNLANDLHNITFNFVEVGNLDNEEDLSDNDVMYGYAPENQPNFNTEIEV